MKPLSMILFLLIILLVNSSSQAMDPPVKMWEKWYYTSYDEAKFFDIELTPAGFLFVSGAVSEYWVDGQNLHPALLLDIDGNVIWDIDSPWYGIVAYDGAITQDSSFIITGTSVVTSSDTYSLFIMKISQEGSIEWSKVYDYPDTKEEGYGITCLPDGGFAVVGRVHGTGNYHGKAWILRTDAQGDTLWTETWGTVNTNWGKSILYANDMLCVLANGADSTQTTYGTHLLFYDLDGEYLGGSDYSNLYLYEPGDFCPASDGGLTFVTNTLPVIWHTDEYGETLWWHNIPEPFGSGTNHEGFCIRQTMDSGYVFSGWGGETPEWDSSPDLAVPHAVDSILDTQDGWLARYDSEGDLQWSFQNCTGTTNHFYSVTQLPEGGYMACGTWGWSGGGYLVRYAPETGIEVEALSPSPEMAVSPNPFSSSLSINFEIPESDLVELSIYDLSGRLVENLISGSVSSGEHLSAWNPGGSVPAGCYIAKLITSGESRYVRCVYLK
ncbi:MAG: T9SS type A sorting domain-containing protein [Candidatus Sabulitectum sp.]|nr:T9SS type A sorting domain-containing protein [Candidatus Sabulitectum sp.]